MRLGRTLHAAIHRKPRRQIQSRRRDTVTGLPRLSACDLRAGDVLLHEPGRPTWYEKGIALGTGSPFTHASIYLGENTIAEARLSVVRTCSVRSPIKRDKTLVVLRQAPELTEVQVDMLRAFVANALKRGARFDFAFPVTYLRSRFVSKFAKAPASSEPLGPLQPANCHKYFCVSFIVDAYCAMGLIDQSERHLYRLGRHAAVDLLTDRKFGQVVGQISGRAPSEHVAPASRQAAAD